MNKIKPPFNINAAAQLAAVAALNDKIFIKKSVKHNFFWANILVHVGSSASLLLQFPH